MIPRVALVYIDINTVTYLGEVRKGVTFAGGGFSLYSKREKKELI